VDGQRPSTRCQARNATASTTAKKIDDAAYGTPNCLWSTSAAMVPTIATSRTANQYTQGM